MDYTLLFLAILLSTLSLAGSDQVQAQFGGLLDDIEPAPTNNVNDLPDATPVETITPILIEQGKNYDIYQIGINQNDENILSYQPTNKDRLADTDRKGNTIWRDHLIYDAGNYIVAESSLNKYEFNKDTCGVEFYENSRSNKILSHEIQQYNDTWNTIPTIQCEIFFGLDQVVTTHHINTPVNQTYYTITYDFDKNFHMEWTYDYMHQAESKQFGFTFICEGDCTAKVGTDKIRHNQVIDKETLITNELVFGNHRLDLKESTHGTTHSLAVSGNKTMINFFDTEPLEHGEILTIDPVLEVGIGTTLAFLSNSPCGTAGSTAFQTQPSQNFLVQKGNTCIASILSWNFNEISSDVISSVTLDINMARISSTISPTTACSIFVNSGTNDWNSINSATTPVVYNDSNLCDPNQQQYVAISKQVSWTPTPGFFTGRTSLDLIVRAEPFSSATIPYTFVSNEPRLSITYIESSELDVPATPSEFTLVNQSHNTITATWNTPTHDGYNTDNEYLTGFKFSQQDATGFAFYNQPLPNVTDSTTLPGALDLTGMEYLYNFNKAEENAFDQPVNASLPITSQDVFFISSSTGDIAQYTTNGIRISNIDIGTYYDGITNYDGNAYGVSSFDFNVQAISPNNELIPSLNFNLDPLNHAPGAITEFNDKFYITDRHDRHVYAYTVTGTYLPDDSFSVRETSGYLQGIAVHNNKFYVLDGYGRNNIYVYTATGTYLPSEKITGIFPSSVRLTDMLAYDEKFWFTAYLDRTILVTNIDGTRSSADDFETLQTQNFGITTLNKGLSAIPVSASYQAPLLPVLAGVTITALEYYCTSDCENTGPVNMAIYTSNPFSGNTPLTPVAQAQSTTHTLGWNSIPITPYTTTIADQQNGIWLAIQSNTIHVPITVGIDNYQLSSFTYPFPNNPTLVASTTEYQTRINFELSQNSYANSIPSESKATDCSNTDPQLVPGIFSNSIQLDANDCIHIPITFQSNLAMGFWFKSDQTTFSPNQQKTLFSVTTSESKQFNIFQTQSSIIAVIRDTSASLLPDTILLTTSHPSNTDWHHIIVTRDQANIWTLYINGTLSSQTTNTESFGTETKTVTLGSQTVTNLNHFVGQFDEFFSGTGNPFVLKIQSKASDIFNRGNSIYSWTDVTTLTNTSLRSTTLTLPTNKQIYVRLQSQNAIFDSPGIILQTFLSSHAAPTDLIANAESPTQIDLAWTVTEGIQPTSYQIQRSTDANTFTILINNTASTLRLYSDNNLTPDTTYHYRILPYHDNVLFSNSTSNTATATTSGVAQPFNFRATTTYPIENNVILTWDLTNNIQPTGYEIHRKLSGTTLSSTTTDFEIIVANTGLIGQTYTDTTGIFGHHYIYKIKSIYLTQEHNLKSEFSHFDIVILGRDVIHTVTVTTPSITTLNLSWTLLPNSDESTGYKIKYASATIPTQILVADTQSTALQYTVTGLTPDTTYFFSVAGLYVTPQYTEESYGLNSQGTTQHISKPILTVTNTTSNSANLTWFTDDSTGVTPQSYRIERILDDNPTPEIIQDNYQGNNYIDTNLYFSTEYTYRIIGLFQSGSTTYQSTPSLSQTTTTGSDLIESFEVTSVTGSEITVQWANYPNSHLPNYYTLRANPSGESTTIFVNVTATTTQYTFSGLDQNKLHTLHINGVINSSGVSPFKHSTVLTTTATTLSEGIASASVISRTNSSLYLEWIPENPQNLPEHYDVSIQIGGITQTSTISTENYNFTSLTPNTQYIISIIAYQTQTDNTDIQYPPHLLTATTDDIPDQVITPSHTNTTTTSITLHWQEPEDNGKPITSYTLQVLNYKVLNRAGYTGVSTDTPGTQLQQITLISTLILPIANLTTTETGYSYIITDLIPYHAYAINITATNQYGDSPYTKYPSPYSSVRTFPLPPTLTATSANDNTIQLAKTNPSNTNLRFTIYFYNPITNITAPFTPTGPSTLSPNLLFFSLLNVDTIYTFTATYTTIPSQHSQPEQYTTVELYTTPLSTPFQYTTLHAPDAINTLTVTPGSLSSVILNWQTPKSYAPSILGYQINYTTPAGDPQTTLTTTTSADTTYTVTNLPTTTPSSFRVAALTIHNLINITNANIATTEVLTPFEIGRIEIPTESNPERIPIQIKETKSDDTIILEVTYPPSTQELVCNVEYRFAQTEQNYTNPGYTMTQKGMKNTTITFNNFQNEIASTKCWDNQNPDVLPAQHLSTQSNTIPFVESIKSFQSGVFGTDGQLGYFDLITLIVIIASMVGFNRTNPAAGIIISVMMLGAASWFGIIQIPTIIFSVIALMVVLAIIVTRKP